MSRILESWLHFSSSELHVTKPVKLSIFGCQIGVVKFTTGGLRHHECQNNSTRCPRWNKKCRFRNRTKAVQWAGRTAASDDQTVAAWLQHKSERKPTHFTPPAHFPLHCCRRSRLHARKIRMNFNKWIKLITWKSTLQYSYWTLYKNETSLIENTTQIDIILDENTRQKRAGSKWHSTNYKFKHALFFQGL